MVESFVGLWRAAYFLASQKSANDSLNQAVCALPQPPARPENIIAKATKQGKFLRCVMIRMQLSGSLKMQQSAKQLQSHSGTCMHPCTGIQTAAQTAVFDSNKAAVYHNSCAKATCNEKSGVRVEFMYIHISGPELNINTS